MKKSLILIAAMNALAVQAQVSPLEYANPTPISSAEAVDVWNSMNTNYKRNSECFNRAMSWSYDIKKKFGFEGKRIYIHFSYLYNKELSSGWGYHTAPVYNVEGEDIVFDRGFGAWVHAPLTPEMWEDKFVQTANDKLVEKRLKLVAKISKTQQEIATLPKSDAEYLRKLESANGKLRDYHAELKLLKVTDEELKVQRPKKIERINRWLKFLRAEIPKFQNDRYVLNQLTWDLQYFENLEKKIQTDLSYAALVSCEKITHIEELDYNKTGAWCFIQEANDFYWNVPQLRDLNYGPGYSLTKVPLTSELPQKRIEGEKYIQTEYDMNQVWAARRQAFGNNYKKIWEQEYSEKEKADEALKNMYKIVRDANNEVRDIQKAVGNSRDLIARYPTLARHAETLNTIEAESNKFQAVVESAQKTVSDLGFKATESAIAAKAKAYSDAQNAKANLESLTGRAKDLEKTIKSATKKL